MTLQTSDISYSKYEAKDNGDQARERFEEAEILEESWGITRSEYLQCLEEDTEKEELKGLLDIIPREEVPIEVESISTKFPIVDWKTYILTETFMYFQVFRGDGSSKNYKILSEMLEDFDRLDVEELYRLVKNRIDQGVGSTSGIRACALRNFDLGKMELENSQNNALAKLPMLKLGEYEMWEIRIKQYFQIQDYALWEVIENGNSLLSFG
ncbi:hypothetical protein Tco_0665012 [Tanacetum coccineum]